jgi:hypothetical protein
MSGNYPWSALSSHMIAVTAQQRHIVTAHFKFVYGKPRQPFDWAKQCRGDLRPWPPIVGRGRGEVLTSPPILRAERRTHR